MKKKYDINYESSDEYQFQNMQLFFKYEMIERERREKEEKEREERKRKRKEVEEEEE